MSDDPDKLRGYRMTIVGAEGFMHHSVWFNTDQEPAQMMTRLDEFVTMLKNHCYQLTLDDQFIGNFRLRANVARWIAANGAIGARPVVIECFPTTPQVCIDDAIPEGPLAVASSSKAAH